MTEPDGTARIIPHWLIPASLLFLVAGGAWFYVTQKDALEATARENLNAIANLKVNQIEQWRAERLGDAAELVESAFNSAALSRWMDGTPSEGSDQILTLFRSYQAYGGYADILLVDGEGKVRLSLSGHPWASGEQTTHTLADALRDHRPKLSDLQENAGSPGPYLDVIAPLFAGKGETIRAVGAVLLRCEARDFLYPLIQSWPLSSRTAETLLVRRDGDSVLYLNELRQQQHTALALRLPLSRTDLPGSRRGSGRGRRVLREGLSRRPCRGDVESHPRLVVVHCRQGRCRGGAGGLAVPLAFSSWR